MISFKIEDVKGFMAYLLSGTMFDSFQVTDVQVKTFITTNISGGLQKEWYREDGQEIPEHEFAFWKEIKPLVFNLVKGKKVPELLMIHFIHPMENGDAGSIRVQFEKEGLRMITGYARKEFALDKEREREWDEKCRKYLHSNQVAAEEEK